jgi:hypothetical protein
VSFLEGEPEILVGEPRLPRVARDGALEKLGDRDPQVSFRRAALASQADSGTVISGIAGHNACG